MEKAKNGLELITTYFDDFSPLQLTRLAALEELYKDWNSKINVISRKDIDSLYEKHVLHSLGIAAAFTLLPGMEILDIGTGGGFPGIPLAIFFPGTQFHLVDSIGKKLKVVEAVRDAIGLTNVTTAHTRAEEIRQRKFDTVVSRAVAPLKDLWTWSKPLLRKPRPGQFHAAQPAPDLIPNGLICLKGGDLSTEIAESGCKPRLMEVYDIFPEEYFKDKYLVYNHL